MSDDSQALRLGFATIGAVFGGLTYVAYRATGWVARACTTTDGSLYPSVGTAQPESSCATEAVSTSAGTRQPLPTTAQTSVRCLKLPTMHYARTQGARFSINTPYTVQNTCRSYGYCCHALSGNFVIPLCLLCRTSLPMQKGQHHQVQVSLKQACWSSGH